MIEPHREEERQVFPPDCFIFEKKSPNCFFVCGKIFIFAVEFEKQQGR
jgi:hypothetical protein